MKKKLAMLDVEKIEIMVALTWERGSGTWALPAEREVGSCPKGHVSFRGWHPGTEQRLTLAITNCHPSSPHFQSLQPSLMSAQAELKIKKEGFDGSYTKIS